MESGLIDIAHHEGHAGSAIKETAHFDDTIQKTIDVLYRHNMINDTLVIVTGDHGHTLSINGYPPRFGNILGKCLIKEKFKLRSLKLFLN